MLAALIPLLVVVVGFDIYLPRGHRPDRSGLLPPPLGLGAAVLGGVPWAGDGVPNNGRSH